MLLLISVVLLILERCMSDAIVNNQRKSFKAIRSAANQTSLCAIDKPTEVIKVEDLNLPPINMVAPSPETLCTWRCARESNCTGYNWKGCNKECEFYSYVPKTCETILGCTHYGLNGASGYESCQGIPERILTATADDVILQLFIDGLQITALPNAAIWNVPDNVVIPRNVCVIAFAVQNNNPPGLGGFLASDSFGTILTNSSWKVSSLSSSGWMDITFDDSSWSNASVKQCNDADVPWAVISGISQEACWIWSNSREDTTLYFRLNIL